MTVHEGVRRVMWVSVTLTALILGAILLAILWPYESVTLQTGPIITEERTSDDMPVVREGAPLTYATEYCNEGVDVRLSRWADQYGPFFDGAGVALADVGPDELTVSYPLDVRDFFNLKAGCGEATASSVLPPLPTGRVYRIRSLTRYEGNPLKTIKVTDETEPFLLLAEGAPIP